MKDVGEYECSKYKAYIYPKKIVICTKLQVFRIICSSRLDKYYLECLKTDILSGKVDRLDNLPTHDGRLIWEACSTRPI